MAVETIRKVLRSPVLAAAIFLVAAAATGARTAMDVDVAGMADFRSTVYYPARAMLDGHNPYDAADYTSTYPVGSTFALYSPALVGLSTPLALLPVGAAETAYFVVNLALLVAVSMLVLTAVARGRRPRLAHALALATVLLITRPGHNTFYLGQTTVLWVAGTTLALVYHRSHPLAAALGVALTTLKPTYGVPLVGMLVLGGSYTAAIGGGLLGTVAALPLTAVLARNAGGIDAFVAALFATPDTFMNNPFASAATGLRVDLAALIEQLAPGLPSMAIELLVLVTVVGAGGLALRRLRAQASTAPAGADTASNGLEYAVVSLSMLAGVYHLYYDALLLALPLAALAFGVWMRAHGPREEPALWALMVLAAVPMVNWVTSYKVIEYFELAGMQRMLVQSLSAMAVVGAWAICLATGFARTGAAAAALTAPGRARREGSTTRPA